MFWSTGTMCIKNFFLPLLACFYKPTVDYLPSIKQQVKLTLSYWNSLIAIYFPPEWVETKTELKGEIANVAFCLLNMYIINCWLMYESYQLYKLNICKNQFSRRPLISILGQNLLVDFKLSWVVLFVPQLTSNLPNSCCMKSYLTYGRVNGSQWLSNCRKNMPKSLKQHGLQNVEKLSC